MQIDRFKSHQGKEERDSHPPRDRGVRQIILIARGFSERVEVGCESQTRRGEGSVVSGVRSVNHTEAD